jgi:hypothetical protein
MNKAQANPKKSERPDTEKEEEKVLSEVTDVDLYDTIKRWEALYPHTYGDQILRELLKKET